MCVGGCVCVGVCSWSFECSSVVDGEKLLMARVSCVLEGIFDRRPDQGDGWMGWVLNVVEVNKYS